MFWFQSLDSSVGRAKDWKSLSQWFDPTSRQLKHNGYPLMVNGLPSKQLIWVRFPLPVF